MPCSTHCDAYKHTFLIWMRLRIHKYQEKTVVSHFLRRDSCWSTIRKFKSATMDYYSIQPNVTAQNCSSFTSHQRMIIGFSGAACALLSLLACCLVISLMIIFKKYNFAPQRLLIYLTLLIIADDINRIIFGICYDMLFDSSSFCTTVAFLTQYMFTCEILVIASFVMESFLRMVLNKQSGRLEWLYVPIIFLTPALIAWIPIVFQAYGPSTATCQISKVNVTTCSQEKIATVLHYSLCRAPALSILVIGGLGYIVIHICFIRKRANYRTLTGTNRTLFHESLENFIYLHYIPPIFALINLIPGIADIMYTLHPGQPIFTLQLMEVIIKSLEGGLLSVFLALDPRTRRRLTWHEIKLACQQTICKTESVVEYPILEGFTDSLQ